MQSSADLVLTGTHGGARPGAGRKPGGITKAQAWERFEKRIFAAASRQYSAEQLRAMCEADPWRFVERIVLPLIGYKQRQVARIGVAVNEGTRQTQFVLDLGELEPGSNVGSEEDGALIDDAIRELTQQIGEKQ